MRSSDRQRVLILGGGFGGVATAQRLRHHFKKTSEVEITLVNRDNYFVFVPLLASAASGSIETLHILNPIRRMLPGVHFRAEEVTGIDLQRRIVSTTSVVTGRETYLGYDHLVLALGNTINLSSLPGVAQHGKTMKSLGDALHLRNHVIAMLEAADVETDPQLRQELLTFVVAGAGFSGVETVGELNDLVHAVAKHYPSLQHDHIRVILLHSRDRILPEMGPELADFALKQLRKRGVDVQLNTRIASATPREAILNNGQRISTRTLIVTVGAAANPVLAPLSLPREKERILTDPAMAVSGHPGIWALGDNAAVPNMAANGTFSPPTAQFALRQGKRLADNIAASIRGQAQQPFAFPGLGQLCLVGHQAGVAELPGNIKLSGFIAFVMWRNVYLSKLPGWDRRVRVALDWTLDLIFPRELSYVNLSRTQVVNQAHYEAGDYIIRQGDVGDLFYVILSGEVEVLREQPNDTATRLATLKQGEYFGESALMSGRRRNASVRALTPVDVMCLGSDDFNTLAGSWLKFSESLQELTNERAPAAQSAGEQSRLFRTIYIGNIINSQLASLAANTHNQPTPAAIPEPQPVPLLQRNDGVELPLEQALLMLGRSSDNHIVLNDQRVSRHHCTLKREGSQYVLEDADTPNGTFVNGQRVKSHTLSNGDVIALGNITFTYKERAVL